MVQVTCQQCGEVFEAKRRSRKYCGDRCQKQARRRATDGEVLEVAPDLPRLVQLTETELRTLGKFDTVLGQQAMTLAGRMVARKDTGSAIAAVSRELDRIMQRLRSGVAQTEDEVASARRRRDEKRRKAAQASQA